VSDGSGRVEAPGPLTSWTGWDVRGGAAQGPDAAEAFSDSTPLGSDKDERYELIAVAARGFRPPRLLRVVPWAGDGEAEPEFGGLRQTWSVQYRHMAETAPAAGTPYAIYLLGVNPPEDATDEDLVLFNDFYTNVHLPEVADRRHALRAVRYELSREVRPPHLGAPRYLAVYEVDEESASKRRHVGPAYSTGPEVWQRHKTPWRLWYRRLGARERSTGPSTTPRK
jgi:hypothetical protein